MKTLLEKISIIDFKYEKLREKDDFNIFSILRSKTDEVRVHSRFIAELLNPKGSHRQGPIFLNHFLNIFGLNPLDFPNAEVFREYKDIDILIRSGNKAIIIENKIWAGDQERQLDRYYDIIISEKITDIKMFYLTLDGKEPSDYSLGNLRYNVERENLLFLKSYKGEILQWLDLCLKEVVVIPSLRETLAQYKNLVNELTGTSMNKEEILEIVELLSQSDNVLKAKKIVQSWKDVIWYTEWYFWQDFEKIVETEYEVLSLNKYDSDKLNASIHSVRNKDHLYGLMFCIKDLGQEKLCIYIEKGNDQHMYYGVTIVNKNNSRESNNDSYYDNLALSIKEHSTLLRQPFWLGGRFFSKVVYFDNNSSDQMFMLLNKDYRQKYIQTLWSEIKAYIQTCKIETYELPANHM